MGCTQDSPLGQMIAKQHTMSLESDSRRGLGPNSWHEVSMPPRVVEIPSFQSLSHSIAMFES
jgi:hypothetical protein